MKKKKRDILTVCNNNIYHLKLHNVCLYHIAQLPNIINTNPEYKKLSKKKLFFLIFLYSKRIIRITSREQKFELMFYNNNYNLFVSFYFALMLFNIIILYYEGLVKL